MKKLALLFILSFITSSVYTQGRFDKVEIKTMEVNSGIYMLVGSGGNIGVSVGEDGVLMVDSQFAPLSDKIKAAIHKISSSEIKFLLNTHWHGDHTGGNNNFGSDGAIIVAHEKVRERMSTDQVNKAFNRNTKASPKDAWPVITFSDDTQLHFNDQDIALLHVHSAHTDGDAFVYFAQANVLHMGDTFFNGRFPYVDLGSGGSVQGIIDAVGKALMIIDDETKIIPGHGALATKTDLEKYGTVVESIYNKVKAAVAKGDSLETIKAAGYTTEYAAWGKGFISEERFLDIIWTDLDRK